MDREIGSRQRKDQMIVKILPAVFFLLIAVVVVVGCYGIAAGVAITAAKATVVGALEHYRNTGFYKRAFGEEV